MNKIIAYSLIFGCVILSRWCCPQPAQAHGTNFRILSGNKAVTAEFYYSDDEAMSYAGVLVFSPQDGKKEYQNGRTDKNGRFAFYPDTAGTWRIEVNDGMGHKVQAEVICGSGKSEQANSQNQPKTPHQSLNKMSKVLLGISLILFMSSLLLWLNARKCLDEHRRKNS